MEKTMKLFNEEKQIDITNSKWAIRALKNSLAVENIKDLCKEPGRPGITELSRQANLIVLTAKPAHEIESKKCAFSKIETDTEKNLLKEFLHTDSLIEFDCGKKECIAQNLKVWKTVYGTDVEIPGQADPDKIFPEDHFQRAPQIFPQAMQKGWVIMKNKNHENKLYLTNEGMKLPKVKRVLELLENGTLLNY